jgi:potassium efflux system protein
MTKFPSLIRPAFIFWLLILSIPLLGQDAPALSETLVDQRIATLRAAGAADSDDALQTYLAVKSWLTRAESHASDTAKYVAELTAAPRRDAKIQARLDARDSEQEEVEEFENLPRQQLEAKLVLNQTNLRDANEALDVLDRKLAARESNAEMLRNRLGEIATRLEELPDQLANVDPAATPSTTEAIQWLELAELLALRAERRAQSARLDSQPVRYSAMRTESAQLRLKIEKLSRRAERISTQLHSERQTTFAPIQLDIETDSPIYGLGQQHKAENVALGAQRLTLELRLAEVKAQREVVERTIRVINERFARARRVVDFATQSDVLGEILLAYWQEIDTLRLDDPSATIPRQIGDTVISRIGHEENLASLVSASAYLGVELSSAGLDFAAVPQNEREVLVDLISGRRELLRNIIAIESGLIDMLSELEADHSRHANSISEYRHYLDPLVLWIPSSPRLWKADFTRLPEEMPALVVSLRHMDASLQAVFFSCSMLALILLLFRTRLRDYQHQQNKRISRAREDSIRFTLVALVVLALRAAPSALLVTALASVFDADTGSSAAALTALLDNLTVWLFAATLLNKLCEDGGIARRHFNWNKDRCDRLQHESKWFMHWWLPSAAMAGVLYTVAADGSLLGRFAMLAIALWLASRFAHNLYSAAKESGAGGLSTHEHRIRFILAFAFFAIAIGIVFGLHLSVSFVTNRLMDMLAAGIALAVVHSFFLRWLLVARRHLRFQELLIARQERAEQSPSEIGVIEEDQAKVAEISEETRQLLNVTAIVVALTILYYLWAPILPLFDAMSGITLWTSTSMVEGEAVVYRITMDILVFVVLLTSITIYAARKLPALVELALRSRTDVSAGARYTASTLLNYVILGTGILVALSTLGLDWSKLQWLVAALGVGIGFGLQEIVANFISGIIILFERPISVGDIITVGDKDGFVTKIRIRATTIRDWDNKELLIPNKEIITGRLLNWSLSDTRLRVSVPVGVAYGSDVELALKILNDTVSDEARIMVDPAPSIIFSGFGESSLDLVCRFYIDNIDHLWPVKTDLHLEIYRRFEAAGIVIAFPQRDIHLDSEQPLRIAIDPRPATE